MKLKTFFLTILCLGIFFFTGCQKKEYPYLEFETIGDIVVKIENPQKNIPTDYQIYQHDTTNWLIFYTRTNKLYIYNLNNNELIKEVKISKKQLSSFYFINPDSIFLLYLSSYFLEYSDSLLQLIDTSGTTKKIYQFEDKHFLTKNNEIDEKEYYVPYIWAQKLELKNDKLFFLITKYYHYELGDTFSRNDTFSNLAYLDIKTSKINFINMPKELPPPNYYYPQAFRYNYVSSMYNGNPFIGYRYSNNLYEYDFELQKVIKHTVKPTLSDTIYPTKDLNEAEQLNYMDKYAGYWSIIYNKYEDYYIRNIGLPRAIYKNNIYLVQFDKNFNIIGEGIAPDGLRTPYFFTKDYIIFWNKQKTYENEGYIYFTKCKIKKTNKNIADEIKKIQIVKDTNQTCTFSKNKNLNTNINIYLSNLIKNRKDFAVLIVPLMESCPSCKEFALTLYSVNKTTFLENNVILLIVNSNKALTKSVLIEKNLNLSHQNIIIDDGSTYSAFLNSKIYNPRVVVVKNNEVIFDKTYYPDELNGIYEPLFNFIKNK